MSSLSLLGPRRRIALVALWTSVVGCGDSDAKSSTRTPVPTVVSTCDIDPSIERTPDDEDRIGDAARALVGKGPCLVDAASRWFAAHPRAREGGTPSGRVIVRALGILVPTLTSSARETALDVLFESEAAGDALVRREALVGLGTVPKAVSERLELALSGPSDAERARARELAKALGLDLRSLATPR